MSIPEFDSDEARRAWWKQEIRRADRLLRWARNGMRGLVREDDSEVVTRALEQYRRSLERLR